MNNVSKSIFASFRDLAENIDNITSNLENSFFTNDGFDYELKVAGDLAFSDSATRYHFSDIEHLKDALMNEDLDDIWIWNIEFAVRGGKSGTETYTWENIVSLDFTMDSTVSGNRYGNRLRVSAIEYSEARTLMDDIVAILKSNYYVAQVVDESAQSREQIAQKSYEILNNLLPLQARIAQEFKDEKDFQRFLYPILKSHFPLLQEEDYLPKLAGKSSKPDFGLVGDGIAFEVKFNKAHSLREIRNEILIDSREYFVNTSPYQTMIVVIYNASGQPIPANYIEDLESIDVIYGVAISPPVTPASSVIKKTTSS